MTIHDSLKSFHSQKHSIAMTRIILRCCVMVAFALMIPAGQVTAQDSDPDLIAEGAALTEVSSDFQFTEGPSADKEGNVYFTDQPNDRLVKWNAKTNELTDFKKPVGRANGTWITPDGTFYLAADEKNELWKMSAEGKVEVITSGLDGKLFNGPNDLWVDPKGGIYFTDPHYQRPYWKRDPAKQIENESVYYIPPGSKTPQLACKDVVKPNGIIGTPDGKTLYVADIGDRKTYAFDIQDDGSLSNQREFCAMGSDGMTLDDQGNLYLTGRGVTVFDKSGKRLMNIPVPQGWTANVTFGGTNHDQLFITASTAVYTLKMNVRGAFAPAMEE